jgi:hypothetical protein
MKQFIFKLTVATLAGTVAGIGVALLLGVDLI